MWSDEEIDQMFGQLAPSDAAEPAPHERVPFPLDSWIQLEQQLNKDATERLVRRRLWQLVGLEALVLLLCLLAWQGWRWQQSASHPALAATGFASHTTSSTATAVTTGQPNERGSRHTTASKAATATNNATTEGATTSANNYQSHNQSIANNSALASAALEQPTNGQLVALPTRRRHFAATGALAVVARRSRKHLHAPTSQEKEQHLAGFMVASRRTTRRHRAGKNSAYPSENETAIASSGAIAVGPARRHRSAHRLRQANQDGLAARFAPRQAKHKHLADSRLPDKLSQAASERLGGMDLMPMRLVPLPLPGAILPVALVPLDLPTTPRPPVATLKMGPRFFITAAAAPDLNTVRFADVQLPTLSYGLLAEYRLTPWLRLQTGLLRTTKTYRARPGDYDWSDSPGVAYYNLGWVEGVCTVLDIPLNLRLDWLRQPGHIIFTSVGLSSYWLQHEHYTYSTVSPSAPHTWQENLSNQNKQFFSVLNLSAGYERTLSPHWSVQAEPYLKIPLAGIGDGHVQLLSGGVLVGVKYGFTY